MKASINVHPTRKLAAVCFCLLALPSYSATGKEPSGIRDVDTAFYAMAPTPPMGWNSFDSYGSNVTESEVKANADFMATYMRQAGWEYVVVDIRFYDEFHESSHSYNILPATPTMDGYGRLLPNVDRFPSAGDGRGFISLADYCHKRGLKFGFHLMRGIPRKAVEQNLPIEGTRYKAADVANLNDTCTWLADMYGVDYRKPGAQEYYNSVFRLYASWGIDFVKIDDLSFPYHAEEIAMIRRAIDQCGRNIVLSASPGETPISDAVHVSRHTNMWRALGDMWDKWAQVKYLFKVMPAWMPYTGPGHYADCDMLPLGHIGPRPEIGDERTSGLTSREEHALLTLFAMTRSPLMMGGELPKTPYETITRLINPGFLSVNQQAVSSRQLRREGDHVTWTATMPNPKSRVVAFFNLDDQVPMVPEKAIYTSPVLSAASGQTTHSIDVNLPAGTRKLYLFVGDGGNGTFYDHADWIAPTLHGPKGDLALEQLRWRSATAGWGSPQVNHSIGGAPLMVGKKKQERGIGTHASSMIVYDIPEGYTHFTATAALDDDCLGHTDGASIQFMVFATDPAGPMPPATTRMSVSLAELGLKGKCTVTDLWTGKHVATVSDRFGVDIPLHDAAMFEITEE